MLPAAFTSHNTFHDPSTPVTETTIRDHTRARGFLHSHQATEAELVEFLETECCKRTVGEMRGELVGSGEEAVNDAPQSTVPDAFLVWEPSQSRNRFARIKTDGSAWLEGKPWRKSSGARPTCAAWRPLSMRKALLAIGFVNNEVVFVDDAGLVERSVRLSFTPTVLTWSPRGVVLCAASIESRDLAFIDAALGTVERCVRAVGWKNAVCDVRFSPKSENLFVSSLKPMTTFRLFDEPSSTFSEPWVCQDAMSFAGWSADGNQFLCGSAADGIVAVNAINGTASIVITSEELEYAAQRTGLPSNSGFSIETSWDTANRLAVMFSAPTSTPTKGLALFVCTSLQQAGGATRLTGRFQGPIFGAAKTIPTTMSFSIKRKGGLAVAFSDGSVKLIELYN